MSINKLNVKNADTLHALLEIALQQFENKERSTGSNVLQAMVGMQVISTLDSLEAGWQSMSEKIEIAAAEKIKQLSVENQQLKEQLELCNSRGKHQVDYNQCLDEVDHYFSFKTKNPVHGIDDVFYLALINEGKKHLEEDIKKLNDNNLKDCMAGIFNTLRKNEIDVKTHKQCFEAVNSLIFENESLKQRAECFDILHVKLLTASPSSFEREQPSSLLDDCKHAIYELLFYKKEINEIKAKLESVSNSENISIKS